MHATVPGRLRIRVDGLYRSEALRAGLEARLPSVPGVRGVCASARTGTVLIFFETGTPAAELIGAVERVLREPDLTRGPALRAAGAAPEADAEAEAWHCLSADAALEKFHGSPTGLSEGEAAERLARCGRNVLAPAAPRSSLRIFLSQFQNLPVALLGGSAVLSVLTGGFADAAVIAAVMLANALFGFFTERQIEQMLHLLGRVPLPRARVLRDGRPVELDAGEIVPGDLVLLARGDTIPADARLVRTEHLTIDESMLTGESENVAKDAAALPERALALGDRRNMAYRGTIITGGAGAGVVVATGEATQIGRIERLVGEARPPETPMQRQLREEAARLVGVAGAACAGVFVVGLLRGCSVAEMIRTSISLAIAAIPEGLPAVATTALSRGVRQLRAQGVLVRRLDAVETLASVRTVCFDKTGTLTRNQQTVTLLFAGGAAHEIEEGAQAPLHDPDVARLLEIAVLCNEVQIPPGGAGGELNGSSTEQALIRVAVDAGMDAAAVRSRFPIERMRHRSERRNRMVTLHRTPKRRFLIAVKGRPSEVLGRCRRELLGGETVPLTRDARRAILEQNDVMAGDALRVLGFAFREVDRPGAGEDTGLVWAGLIGMRDPLRPEAGSLVARFHLAGIRTILITGDQSATAQAIGRAVRIGGNGTDTIDARALETLSPEALQQAARTAQVFARVSPAHKLQVVRALQSSGEVVAMTGDGINDGPALKAADVGIAVGGREAARNVADMVLIEDDLRKLLAAVAQGRTISDNIRKAVSYLLATNMTEIGLSLLGLLLGLGRPLTAMQLLWINLVSDVLPQLALVCEPAEGDVLAQPPKPAGAPLIPHEEFHRLFVDAALITGGALASFAIGTARHGRSPAASTMAFTSLVTGQLAHTWTARSRRSAFEPWFAGAARTPLAPNPAAPLAVGVGLLLEAAAILTPALRRTLGTTLLRPTDWLVSALGGAIPFLMNELRKAAGGATANLEITENEARSIASHPAGGRAASAHETELNTGGSEPSCGNFSSERRLDTPPENRGASRGRFALR